MNFIYIVLKTFFSDFYHCILYYVYLLGFQIDFCKVPLDLRTLALYK